MPIKFTCPAGHLLNAADKLAGGEVRCPQCGAKARVPRNESNDATASTSKLSTPTTQPTVVPPSPAPATSTAAAATPIPPPKPAPPASATSPAPPAASATAPSPSSTTGSPAPPPPGNTASEPAAPPAPAIPPPLPGYECPPRQRLFAHGIAAALGGIAFALCVPAMVEIADHLTAASSTGVARWAFALLALAVLHVGYAIYVWQAPDWSSVFVVAIAELVHAMLLSFVLGLLLAARTEHSLVRWFDLADAMRSDLARVWCFFVLALASAVAFWSGRFGLAWRRQLGDS